MWFSPTLLTGLFDGFAFVNSLRINVWLTKKLNCLKYQWRCNSDGTSTGTENRDNGKIDQKFVRAEC